MLVCAKCTDVFSEEKIYTHKFGCKKSKFDDISFLLSKENILNVLEREIEVMIQVLDNDLSHEKLRTDAKLFRVEKGADKILVTAGKCIIYRLPFSVNNLNRF